jgi:hypothetical protein
LFVFVGGMSANEPYHMPEAGKYGCAVSSLRKLSSGGYLTPTVALLSSCRRLTSIVGTKGACPSGMVVTVLRGADTGGGFASCPGSFGRQGDLPAP